MGSAICFFSYLVVSYVLGFYLIGQIYRTTKSSPKDVPSGILWIISPFVVPFMLMGEIGFYMTKIIESKHD